jgi:hypothetical protein
MAKKKKLTNNKLKPTVYKVSTLSSTSKPKTKSKTAKEILANSKATKPAKAKPKKNTLINRIREDWSQPKPTWVGGGKGLREPAYDKYPYGSLTGRKKK